MGRKGGGRGEGEGTPGRGGAKRGKMQVVCRVCRR